MYIHAKLMYSYLSVSDVSETGKDVCSYNRKQNRTDFITNRNTGKVTDGSKGRKWIKYSPYY